MARSITGLVGLAATLVLALPVAMLSVEFLLRGRTLPGAGLLVVAVLMIAVEEYVTSAGDLPTLVAERTVGRLAEPPDEDE